MHQIKLLAEYQDEKTEEKRIVESFSKAHAQKPDIKEISADFLDEMGETDHVEYDTMREMVDEAIRDGQARLGGSNWFLLRIIDIEVITFNIG